MEEYLALAMHIAYYSGNIILKYNDDEKVMNDLIDEYFFKQVTNEYGGCCASCKKYKYDAGTEYLWICDAKDDIFSLVLMFKNIPIISVIYNPIIDKMYYALEHMGAYCNGMNIEKIESIIPNILLDNTYENCNMEAVKLIVKETKSNYMNDNTLIFKNILYKVR